MEKKTIYKHFKVVTVSKNTNSFGLYGVILLAKNGEAYQVGHNYLSLPKENDIIPIENSKQGLNWAKAGFEIAERLSPNAPKEVIKQVWN